MKKITPFLIVLLLPMFAFAQADSALWTPTQPTGYKFIHYNENVITKHNKLDSVFKKLVKIKHTHKGKLVIVHIGDSHLQADGITSVVRKGFHSYFGDAGRGLVFPYQLANSNAPPDIASSSNTSWEGNRLVNPKKQTKTGISGFGIHSKQNNATIRMYLKEGDDSTQEKFDRMVFFLGKDSIRYRITDSNLKRPTTFCSGPDCISPMTVVQTDSMLTGFELSCNMTPEGNDVCFYGVSLEKKDSSGVIYHTIGVNGARYDQYLASQLFWEQLEALHADMFIVSMGTNEAQNPHPNVETFMKVCDSFVQRIQDIAPKATVMLTTPPGSYYRAKKPNAAIYPITTALLNVCEENELPSWDLFKMTGGKNSALNLKKAGLFSHDLVHFNNEGYRLQGMLLLDAFAKAYNKYAVAHPYKPPFKPPVNKKPVVPVKKKK